MRPFRSTISVAGPFQLHDVGLRSDGGDFAAGDRDGLGGWMRVVHRNDVAAKKDSICYACFIHGTSLQCRTVVPPASARRFEGEARGMDYTLARMLIYFALVVVTFVLAYLYQRNERKQRVRGIWIWPAIFTILAAIAVVRELPKDPSIVPWLALRS